MSSQEIKNEDDFTLFVSNPLQNHLTNGKSAAA
jgi:hypothetical protein